MIAASDIERARAVPIEAELEQPEPFDNEPVQ